VSAPIHIADIHGKPFELVRTPTVEQLQRSMELIAAVEQLQPRQKIIIGHGREPMTRVEFWKCTAYSMKHRVERFKENGSHYAGYISSEAAILAAVLYGAGVKNCRYEHNQDGSRRSLLTCDFVAPKKGEQS